MTNLTLRLIEKNALNEADRLPGVHHDLQGVA